MLLPNLLITLATIASATNVVLYYGEKCRGAHAFCDELAPAHCCCLVCVTKNRGAASASLEKSESGSKLYGYQRMYPTDCGAVAGHMDMGGPMHCLGLPRGWGTLSGAKWFPPGSHDPPIQSVHSTSLADCTGWAAPNRLILEDGYTFVLNEIEPALIQDLHAFAANGSTLADLPGTLAALGQDA